MREFKFRAWDGMNMFNLYNISRFALHPDLDVDGVFVPFCDDMEIMQYTGLKDKNSKEIYEGDIVKITRHWSKTMSLIQEVIYEGATFSPFDDSDWGWVSSESEVIGNIYENPELLSGK